jgi:hypothetical protein
LLSAVAVGCAGGEVIVLHVVDANVKVRAAGWASGSVCASLGSSATCGALLLSATGSEVGVAGASGGGAVAAVPVALGASMISKSESEPSLSGASSEVCGV